MGQDSGATSEMKSSYDPNFKLKMEDEGIYSHNRGSTPTNILEIRDHLLEHRVSLSPSQFGDAEFQEFIELHEKESSESWVLANIFTVIAGKGSRKYESDGPDHPLNHLEPFGEFLVTAKPDGYDGALPSQIDQGVRQDLRQYIVPCNNTSRPAAPNFFVEVKSAEGRADVAKLQACYGGTIGARAMHHLQNYGAAEPQYDGCMKSYSATYHPGTETLLLYGHHTTRPKAPGGRQEYHMTRIGTYGMTGSPEGFREGATAFRNLRALAKKHRDELIDQANCVARHAPIPTNAPGSSSVQNLGNRGNFYSAIGAVTQVFHWGRR